MIGRIIATSVLLLWKSQLWVGEWFSNRRLCFYLLWGLGSSLVTLEKWSFPLQQFVINTTKLSLWLSWLELCKVRDQAGLQCRLLQAIISHCYCLALKLVLPPLTYLSNLCSLHTSETGVLLFAITTVECWPISFPIHFWPSNYKL